MMHNIKTVIARSEATIWQDMIGGASLMVVFLGAMLLPSML